MKQQNMINCGNRAAAYCRLSKDDDQIGESSSIQTQRDMLTMYIKMVPLSRPRPANLS